MRLAMRPPRFLVRAAKQVLNATTSQTRSLHPVPASCLKSLEGIELILAAGMPRSASTWLYNAARLLLCSSPDIAEKMSCGWVGDLRRIPKKQVLLIKLHEFDPGLLAHASKIIYSNRDIKEALESSQRKFGDAPNPRRAATFAQLDEQWTHVADYVMNFESMLANKENILEHLSKALDVTDYDAQAILKEMENLSYASEGPKNENYHEVNLFHQGHRTTLVKEPAA